MIYVGKKGYSRDYIQGLLVFQKKKKASGCVLFNNA
jgi:hypothetical protein